MLGFELVQAINDKQQLEDYYVLMSSYLGGSHDLRNMKLLCNILDTIIKSGNLNTIADGFSLGKYGDQTTSQGQPLVMKKVGSLGKD